MKRKIVLTLLLAAFSIIVVTGQERYVKPVDEANLDKSFLEFRTKLIAAAERRDANYIISILDPKIFVSFGGETGISDFKKFWKLSSKYTKFWDAFLPVIKNGGMFDRETGKRQDQFFAPYTFNAFPDDLDAFTYSVIFGNNVNLRERPAANARVLGQLSYNVVTIVDTVSKKGNTDKADWHQIETLGGQKGWVKAEYVRSPIDYRAGFEKKGGVWRMTTFVAGD
jgi:hypothetical protein